jgi:hypothetical protein
MKMAKGDKRPVDERLKALKEKEKKLLQEKANERKSRALDFANALWLLYKDEAQRKLLPEGVMTAFKTHLLGYGDWVITETPAPASGAPVAGDAEESKKQAGK